MSVVLAGTDLRYAVGDRVILDGISVQACSGRVLAVRGPSGSAVRGPSGSGKSSLLAMLDGLIAPASGAVTLDGAPVTPGSDLVQRRRFGLILQGYGLVAALTAYENVAVVLQAAGAPRAEVRTRTHAVLEQVGLSAVDVLLADEPTGQLDADNRGSIVSLLVKRARLGAAVVIASHDPDVIDACDDVLDL